MCFKAFVIGLLFALLHFNAFEFSLLKKVINVLKRLGLDEMLNDDLFRYVRGVSLYIFLR